MKNGIEREKVNLYFFQVKKNLLNLKSLSKHLLLYDFLIRLNSEFTNIIGISKMYDGRIIFFHVDTN